MKKKAETIPTTKLFKFSPFDLLVYGVDKDPGLEEAKQYIQDSRALVDERNPEFAGLVESIDRDGVRDPVTVVQLSTGCYAVTVGRQRVNACRRVWERRRKRGQSDEEIFKTRAVVAKINRLPVDDVTHALDNLSHNVRIGVKASPVWLARMAALGLKGGAEPEEVASKCGFFKKEGEPDTIRLEQLLSINKLPKPARDKLDSGEISIGAAIHLATMPAGDERDAALEALAAGKKLTKQAVKEAKAKAEGKKTSRAMASVKKAHLRQIHKALEAHVPSGEYEEGVKIGILVFLEALTGDWRYSADTYVAEGDGDPVPLVYQLFSDVDLPPIQQATRPGGKTKEKKDKKNSQNETEEE